MRKALNPFIWLSGEKSLATGIIGAILTGGVAWAGGESFRGVISQGYAELTLWQTLLQSLAGWAVLSSLLYAAALGLSRSKVRAIDLYGNQLMARIAMLPLFCVGAIPSIREWSLSMLTMSPEQILRTDMTPMAVMAFIAIVAVVWFFIWSYQGFSVAANLRGWKGGVSYVVCYLAAEIAGSYLTATIGSWE